jgi:hypothetical protein
MKLRHIGLLLESIGRKIHITMDTAHRTTTGMHHVQSKRPLKRV